MVRISEFTLENVRCFEGRQSAKTRRITLLVGPNSSGKSTFLGCYQAFADLVNMQTWEGRELLDDENRFDGDPYRMGKFDTVVRQSTDSFSVEGKFEHHYHSGARYEFLSGDDGKPLENSLHIFKDENETMSSFRIARNDNNPNHIEWEIKAPYLSHIQSDVSIGYKQLSTWLSRIASTGSYSAMIRDYNSSSVSDNKSITIRLENFFLSKLRLAESPWFAVQSLAPTPEFSRVRSYGGEALEFSDKEIGIIKDIGNKTKLWKDIIFDKDKFENYFQINIKTPGSIRNLVDVGYGIYNLLPLVIAVTKSEKPSTFLLQQPEIHLHPESQAELARWMVESDHDYLIETHSEHFLDRFRICVMRELIKPEDVSIVYFENSGNNTILHDIGIDRDGNLVDVPKGYHKFFKKESNLLLGFDKDF